MRKAGFHLTRLGYNFLKFHAGKNMKRVCSYVADSVNLFKPSVPSHPYQQGESISKSGGGIFHFNLN